MKDTNKYGKLSIPTEIITIALFPILVKYSLLDFSIHYTAGMYSNYSGAGGEIAFIYQIK